MKLKVKVSRNRFWRGKECWCFHHHFDVRHNQVVTFALRCINILRNSLVFISVSALGLTQGYWMRTERIGHLNGILVAIKKKVKCTLVQALRLCTGRTVYKGSRGIALSFHDHGTRRGWGVSVTPRPHFTPGKTRYALYRRLRGPKGRSGQVRKISPPTGIRSPNPPASSQSLYRLSYRAHNYGGILLKSFLVDQYNDPKPTKSSKQSREALYKEGANTRILGRISCWYSYVSWGVGQ